MVALLVILVWSLVAAGSAITAGILAGKKNRSAAAWVAWCFLLPPALLVLAWLPANAQLQVRSSSRDEDDDDDERVLL
jgi:hypothetical protein